MGDSKWTRRTLFVGGSSRLRPTRGIRVICMALRLTIYDRLASKVRPPVAS